MTAEQDALIRRAAGVKGTYLTNFTVTATLAHARDVLADIDGMRVTAFITDTAPGAVPGQLAGLELRHRQHARVEDRIRETKAAGLANLPCDDFQSNATWLEIVLAAPDLVAWAQLIAFTDTPQLARCEINLKDPGPRNARPPRRHGRGEHTPKPKSLLLSAFHCSAPPNPTGTKNRG